MGNAKPRRCAHHAIASAPSLPSLAGTTLPARFHSARGACKSIACEGTSAPGSAAVALNYATTASGLNAVAMGFDTLASVQSRLHLDQIQRRAAIWHGHGLQHCGKLWCC